VRTLPFLYLFFTEFVFGDGGCRLLARIGANWRIFQPFFGARPRSRRLIATKRHKQSEKYLQAADAEKVAVDAGAPRNASAAQ